jgi:methylisocitrate lyase
VKAALDARRDDKLVIIARTDAAGVNGIDDAIERAQLYVEAGADMGRPQGVDTPEGITRIVREVPGPCFAILSQAAGGRRLDIEDLEKLGVAGVTLPTVALYAAAWNVKRVLAELRRSNSLASVEDKLVPLDDYYEVVGFDRELARADGYQEAARALVSRKRSEAEA